MMRRTTGKPLILILTGLESIDADRLVLGYTTPSEHRSISLRPLCKI